MEHKLVDFTTPVYHNVNEVVVSGTGSPEGAGVDDLAGEDVWVCRSSSYFGSLTALNQRFPGENKPLVTNKGAPETHWGTRS